MNAASLDVLALNIEGIAKQLAQVTTQARRARWQGGSPTLVDSAVDACSLSEVAGLLGGAEAAVRMAALSVEALQREIARRQDAAIAADGRA